MNRISQKVESNHEQRMRGARPGVPKWRALPLKKITKNRPERGLNPGHEGPWFKKKYPVDLNQGLANRLRAVSKYHTVSTLRGTLSGQIIMGGRPPPKKKKKKKKNAHLMLNKARKKKKRKR